MGSISSSERKAPRFHRNGGFLRIFHVGDGVLDVPPAPMGAGCRKSQIFGGPSGRPAPTGAAVIAGVYCGTVDARSLQWVSLFVGAIQESPADAEWRRKKSCLPHRGRGTTKWWWGCRLARGDTPPVGCRRQPPAGGPVAALTVHRTVIHSHDCASLTPIPAGQGSH